MSCKVLVADESLIIRKTVELVLSDGDYAVESIGFGDEALRIIKDNVPDFVLADTELAEMNGYELCGAVKKTPSLKDVQVILLVPAVKGVDEEKVKSAGADDYMIKPFEAEELLKKIEIAKTSKDTITRLEKEGQQFRDKLRRAEEKAGRINNDLLSRIEAVKESEGTVSRLRDELQQAGGKIDKLKEELLGKTDVVKESEDTIARLKNELRQSVEKADKTNKEFVEKTLRQAIPQITGKILDGILEEDLMAGVKQAIKKNMEKEIPQRVEKAIAEEIKKIK